MPEPLSTVFRVRTSENVVVTVKLDTPAQPRPDAPFFVLAHGANNDLDFPLLAHLASHLPQTAETAVVRFNFPYVERGVTSPDARPVLEATFMSVYRHVATQFAPPGAPIFVGGKSLGGRTAAELISRHAEGSGVAAAGLVILGYPLHKPGEKEHLFLNPIRHIDIPSLFCIGSRDPLCDPNLLEPVLRDLVIPGNLYVVEHGDHSLHLPASKGRHQHDSYEPVTREISAFIAGTSANRGKSPSSVE